MTNAGDVAALLGHEEEKEALRTKIKEATNLILNYARIDGDHHKMWTLDQVLRILAGDQYEELIDEYEDRDEYGDPMYDWDVGCPP